MSLRWIVPVTLLAFVDTAMARPFLDNVYPDGANTTFTGGVLTGDLDLNGVADIITDADGDSKISPDGGDDTIRFYTGASQRFRITNTDLVVNGAVNLTLNNSAAKIYNTAASLNLGTAFTTGHALATGDIGTGGSLEVDGDIWADAVFYAANGTAALPSIALAGSPTTGLYRVGADRMGVTTNGVVKWIFESAGNLTAQSATAIITAGAGAVGDPGYSFGGDTDTGMYRVGADNLGFGTNGALRLDISDTLATFAVPLSSATLFIPETTTPTPIASSGAVYTKSDNKLYFQDGAGIEHLIGGAVTELSTFAMTAISTGTHYAAGYYEAPAADANLDESNPGTSDKVILGGADDEPWGAHAFLVSSGDGAASGGSGAITVVVTGTSIADDGTRVDADTETIVADVTAEALDAYSETTKRWLGQVTYTLTVGATGHTAYNLTFNYGYAKYFDHFNEDFTITGIDCQGVGGSNNSIDIELLHHEEAGWSYSAAAFVSGAHRVAQLSTDHGAEDEMTTGKPWAWKHNSLSHAVEGSGSEGFIIRYTMGGANAVDSSTCAVGYTQ